jgi:SAM-dependent methyltransferase
MADASKKVKAPIRFHLDGFDRERIRGWVDADGPVESVSVEVNGRWVADISPTLPRSDLIPHGLGDGRRGFDFLLHGYLRDEPAPEISLKIKGEEFFRQAISASVPKSSELDPATSTRLLGLSQTRWKADEPAAGLTWGVMMDGKSLWSIYLRTRSFAPSDRVLEIGPGYGRLLTTALEASVPFDDYVGVEMSPVRVKTLKKKFSDGRVKFKVGDVNIWRGNREFDVVICSSTFEHLFPDCRKALINLRSQVAAGAHLFIDFIGTEATSAGFEPTNTFVRCYRSEELRSLFAECGYSVVDVVPVVLNPGGQSREIARKLVIAVPI